MDESLLNQLKAYKSFQSSKYIPVRGDEITISFENIERFKFLDSSKSFEDLFKEKMVSIITLSDLVPTNSNNSSTSQYIKSDGLSKAYDYLEDSSNINSITLFSQYI